MVWPAFHTGKDTAPIWRRRPAPMYRTGMNLRPILNARALAAAALLVATARAGQAQEFIPPDRRPSPPPPPSAEPGQATAETRGVFIDIFAFSTRAGAQVNRDGQAVLGSTIDLVQLGMPRLRLRPSFEVGFGRPEKSLGVNAEVIYRFQPDAAPAIPYVGLGVGYYDDGTTDFIWPTVALGFELPLRRSYNWLVEYHGLDGLKRSRFFIGLTTRGG